MKALTARATDGGQLDGAEDSLKGGTTVTLLVPDGEEGFKPTPEESSLLLEAIAQGDRGEFADGWQLLAELED